MREVREKIPFFFSIKLKIFICIISFVIVITVIVDAAIYHVYKKDLEEKIFKSDSEILNLMSKNMDISIEALEQDLVFKMEACGIFTELGTSQQQTRFSVDRKLRNLAAVLHAVNFPVKDILICDSENVLYFYSESKTIEEKRVEFQKMQTHMVISADKNSAELCSGMVQWKSFPDDASSLYLLKSLIDPDTLQNVGILCLRIDRHFIKRLDNTVGCRICIYDKADSVIYSDDEIRNVATAFGEQLTFGSAVNVDYKGYFVSAVPVVRKKWTLAGFSSRERILANLHRLVWELLFFETILCVIACLTAARISRSMTYNIAALMDNFKKIGAGKEFVAIRYHSNDETSCLCEKFNQMNLMLKKSIEATTYNSIQKEKAEYAALLAQMNPHFLYNTLDSVKALAVLHKESAIASAIQCLSNLLRVSISGESQETEITQELAYIQQYLNLQKLITGNRIHWDMYAEDDIKKCLVPKLVLQPIIENSIIHGVGDMIEDAMIGIVLYRKKDVLYMEVSDNGSGMDQFVADHLLDEDPLEADFRKDRSRMGLKNVLRRIHILYGTGYGVNIRSSRGNGMVVTITVPYHEKDIAHAANLSC